MNSKNLIPFDGECFYIQNFLQENFFEAVFNNSKWRQDEIKLFGKVIPIPRLQAWYGDEGATYQYSTLTLEPIPWYEELSQIKKLVEKELGTTFNSALLNYYETGRHYSAWHADNEKSLGDNPTIASISLGGDRLFHLRHRKTKETIKLTLENNSLLVMRGPLQHHWIHQLAKTARPVDPRINITFRTIKDF